MPSIVGFGSGTSSRNQVMQCYRLLSTDGSSGFPQHCIIVIIWDSYRSTCFDDPPLGQMLIGAVQPCLDFVVADFNCLQQCRRKQSVIRCFRHIASSQILSYPFEDMPTIMVRQNRMEEAYSNLLNGECKLKVEPTETGKATEFLDKGLMQYGCPHYRRRCRIRAPCCNEVFDCRHCHNEAKNNINVDQKHRHDIPRHQVKQVICSLCGTEQEVQQVCVNCGVCMGKYFCEICKLFDDDISKKQYHCNGCGICRIGGRENFFHCNKCGCCYSTMLKNSHPCVEGAMHHDCPVCFEFLFDSRYDVSVMPCGHTIHKNCLQGMRDHFQYACPLCSKSVCDMSKVWEKYDMEIAASPMPEPYQNRLVWILCNDCGKSSKVQYHVVAHKCLNCKSYNTRQTRG